MSYLTLLLAVGDPIIPAPEFKSIEALKEYIQKEYGISVGDDDIISKVEITRRSTLDINFLAYSSLDDYARKNNMDAIVNVREKKDHKFYLPKKMRAYEVTATLVKLSPRIHDQIDEILNSYSDPSGKLKVIMHELSTA